MNEESIKAILNRVQQGEESVENAFQKFRNFPFEALEDAIIDHHRPLRQGFPEVIFGENKTVEQIDQIIRAILKKDDPVLATRISKEKAEILCKTFPQAVWHKEARCITIEQQPVEIKGKGTILVISAGTSDIPIASEAIVTAKIMGNRVEQLFDVGVAGIHRLLAKQELIQSANVIIVVAGMEGALPSVVGGLVSRPVIAVPTSVGYGASFGGVAALLGMLNSCASGVTVVNIDNGFGAGYAASLMNRDK
ncbi:MAG: nickel pincer cofactor biosynthesis protein LarB [Desulfuromonadales bacterium]|nr:nickel pincer cofactor biosynthesis protein LarB [Desulfuromonadales bacterium]